MPEEGWISTSLYLVCVRLLCLGYKSLQDPSMVYKVTVHVSPGWPVAGRFLTAQKLKSTPADLQDDVKYRLRQVSRSRYPAVPVTALAGARRKGWIRRENSRCRCPPAPGPAPRQARLRAARAGRPLPRAPLKRPWSKGPLSWDLVCLWSVLLLEDPAFSN